MTLKNKILTTGCQVKTIYTIAGNAHAANASPIRAVVRSSNIASRNESGRPRDSDVYLLK
jgi:hypothetical protein